MDTPSVHFHVKICISRRVAFPLETSGLLRKPYLTIFASHFFVHMKTIQRPLTKPLISYLYHLEYILHLSSSVHWISPRGLAMWLVFSKDPSCLSQSRASSVPAQRVLTGIPTSAGSPLGSCFKVQWEDAAHLSKGSSAAKSVRSRSDTWTCWEGILAGTQHKKHVSIQSQWKCFISTANWPWQNTNWTWTKV